MKLHINGRAVDVPAGATVASAIAKERVAGFAPLCGMGSCHQCRATIDGVSYCRTCMVLCRDGMEVRTDV